LSRHPPASPRAWSKRTIDFELDPRFEFPPIGNICPELPRKFWMASGDSQAHLLPKRGLHAHRKRSQRRLAAYVRRVRPEPTNQITHPKTKIASTPLEAKPRQQ
jgi:hypothetical protein